MSRGGLLGRLSRPLTTKITRVHLERFLQGQATPKRTLDIGASIGSYAAYFPNRVGVDIERAAGVDIVADAHALSFRDGSFEVVLATEVLEHLQEPQKAVDEMFRVLKPGGTLLLTTRFLFPLHDAPHDYFRYTRYGLEYLLRQMFGNEPLDPRQFRGRQSQASGIAWSVADEIEHVVCSVHAARRL